MALRSHPGFYHTQACFKNVLYKITDLNISTQSCLMNVLPCAIVGSTYCDDARVHCKEGESNRATATRRY